MTPTMKTCSDLRAMMPEGADVVDCCASCHDDEEMGYEGLIFEITHNSTEFRVCCCMDAWYTNYSIGLEKKF